MLVSFEKKLEELKRAKEEKIEYEKYSRGIRRELADDKCLEKELINLLDKVLLCRDEYVYILDVLKLGEDFGLDKDGFCINTTKRWKFSVKRSHKEGNLNVSIYDKTSKGEGTLVECVYPFECHYGCKGKIYIKWRLFCGINDRRVGKIFQDTILATEDEYKEALRNLVFDFKAVDFRSCLDSSIDELIQEQEKRGL